MSKKIVWTKYISPESKFYSKVKNRKGIFLNGPNGVIFPDNVPDKKFNLFEGDANFIITVRDFKNITRTPGVEVAYPLTPYKVMVGVAKMFDENTVIASIDKVVNPYIGIHEEIVQNYLKVAKDLYQNYIVYEDMYKMIHIVDESQEGNIIDGFTIFRKNPKASGV